jgi:hypothetical protein
MTLEGKKGLRKGEPFLKKSLGFLSMLFVLYFS